MRRNALCALEVIGGFALQAFVKMNIFRAAGETDMPGIDLTGGGSAGPFRLADHPGFAPAALRLAIFAIIETIFQQQATQTQPKIGCDNMCFD